MVYATSLTDYCSCISMRCPIYTLHSHKHRVTHNSRRQHQLLLDNCKMTCWLPLIAFSCYRFRSKPNEFWGSAFHKAIWFFFSLKKKTLCLQRNEHKGICVLQHFIVKFISIRKFRCSWLFDQFFVSVITDLFDLKWSPSVTAFGSTIATLSWHICWQKYCYRSFCTSFVF